MLSRLSLILVLLGSGAVRADDTFTQSLSAVDFKATGLGKLTPDELAKLDALVRGQQTGAIAKAKEETTKVVAASVREQVQAEDHQASSAKPAAPGFMERMKVVLKPGTEIEYSTLDATLVPPFRGWHRGTVFTLTNGQLWVVTDTDDYWAPTDKPVHVRIVPGSLGSFFMEIENGGRPRVKFLGNTAAVKVPAAPP
jgi:hypothetical protein